MNRAGLGFIAALGLATVAGAAASGPRLVDKVSRLDASSLLMSNEPSFGAKLQSGCGNDEIGRRMSALGIKLTGFLSGFGEKEEAVVVLRSYKGEGIESQGATVVAKSSITGDSMIVPLGVGSIKSYDRLGPAFRIIPRQIVVAEVSLVSPNQLDLDLRRLNRPVASDLAEVENCGPINLANKERK